MLDFCSIHQLLSAKVQLLCEFSLKSWTRKYKEIFYRFQFTHSRKYLIWETEVIYLLNMRCTTNLKHFDRCLSLKGTTVHQNVKINLCKYLGSKRGFVQFEDVGVWFSFYVYKIENILYIDASFFSISVFKHLYKWLYFLTVHISGIFFKEVLCWKTNDGDKYSIYKFGNETCSLATSEPR